PVESMVTERGLDQNGGVGFPVDHEVPQLSVASNPQFMLEVFRRHLKAVPEGLQDPRLRGLSVSLPPVRFAARPAVYATCCRTQYGPSVGPVGHGRSLCRR